MKYSLLHRVITLSVLAGSFLAIASPAHAELKVIPVLYQHEGLTFAQSSTSEQQFSPTKTSISFGTNEGLHLFANDNNVKKPSLIVSPTIGQGQGTTVFQAVIPTPKLVLATTDTPSNKSVTPTQLPQPTKAQLSTPTIKAAATIAPVSTVAPTQTPVTVAAAPVSGGMADQLFSMTNNYRQAHGLAALQKDDRTCSLAASRAPEVAGEVASGTMHSGLRARALPYWNTENIISMNSAEAAFNWWVNDPIHHDAIVGNYTYSCVACSGNSCAQEFTNYQAK